MSQGKISKKQLEILLIISTKSVILTKNKNNNSTQALQPLMSNWDKRKNR